MKCNGLQVFTCVLASAAALAGCSEQGLSGESPAFELTGDQPTAVELELEQTTEETGQIQQGLTAHLGRNCGNDPRVVAGLVDVLVCRGANEFFRNGFGGNGRTCGSCHRVEDNFTISPEFIGALPPDDPLFAAEQDPNIATLERSPLLRSFGLILENVDGLDDLANKFTLRSIPHTLSLATSINSGRTEPPLDATGWSGDGAPGDGTLRDFLTGAVNQHYPSDLSRTDGVSFNLPTNVQLNRVEAYQLALGRTNELDINTISVNDNRATNGIAVFLANRCNGCHRNLGANVGSGVNRNFNTGVEDLTPLPNHIPEDGGFGTDPNASGSFGDGTFNTPPLIEAADTPPFFHNNVARTLEESIFFYNSDAFNNSPAGLAGAEIDMTVAEIIDVGRFMRVVNASFNLAMAIQRLEAAEILMNQFGTTEIPTQDELLQLAIYELEDAVQVMERAKGGVLQFGVQQDIAESMLQATAAQLTTDGTQRLSDVAAALTQANNAKAALGTGMDFVLGEGNLMR